MARIISATSIPMKMRKPHLDRYRSQLRDALLSPALSTEQRSRVKEKLARVGKTKIYGAAPTNSPGAKPKAAPVAPEPEETLEDLLTQTKGELLTLAEQEGVSVKTSWKKDHVAQAILDNRSAN